MGCYLITVRCISNDQCCIPPGTQILEEDDTVFSVSFSSEKELIYRMNQC